jgi:hypothetical protein
VSDELLQVLFALGLILFGLFGGRKKKRGSRPPAPSRRPPAPAPRRPQPAQNPYQSTLDSLEHILSGRTPTPRPAGVPDPTEAYSLESTAIEEVGAQWQAGLDRRNESLETLEAAGGASHVAFHARYINEPSAVPTISDTADRGPDPATIRHAIIWSEILGPPVGLR